MKITEVYITPIRASGSLVALARVVLDGVLAIDSIGIHLKLAGGYRVTYPTKSGHYLFHPIEKEWGNMLEEAIYNEMSKVKAVSYDRHSSHYAAS